MTTTTFFFVFIPLLAFILLSINLIFAPHNSYQEKDREFECGYHSFLGQSRTQFSISFFIFALLFLLFDLEILLVYPYVVSAYTNAIYGLIIMLMFFIALTLGFTFELGKNALKIDSKQMFDIPSNKTSNTSNVDHMLQSYVIDISGIFTVVKMIDFSAIMNVISNINVDPKTLESIACVVGMCFAGAFKVLESIPQYLLDGSLQGVTEYICTPDVSKAYDTAQDIISAIPKGSLKGIFYGTMPISSIYPVPDSNDITVMTNFVNWNFDAWRGWPNPFISHLEDLNNRIMDRFPDGSINPPYRWYMINSEIENIRLLISYYERLVATIQYQMGLIDWNAWMDAAYLHPEFTHDPLVIRAEYEYLINHMYQRWHSLNQAFPDRFSNINYYALTPSQGYGVDPNNVHRNSHTWRGLMHTFERERNRLRNLRSIYMLLTRQ